MKLEITKGEYKGERTGIIAVHPVGVKNSIGRNIATCNSLFIPESEMLANQTVIVDSLNTYQQCGKLPSTLLQENEKMKSLLKRVGARLFIGESINSSDLVYTDIKDLLTKLKAE